MDNTADRAVAVVGVGALFPDAPDALSYWNNIRSKRYSITEVPPERWSIADYYDPDPTAPDKTYSKIGAWVRGFAFDWKRFRIPPRVAAAMDEGQQWAVKIADEALTDYGYPNRPLDTERTGVILGTAMGGELHYITALRIFFPEYAHALKDAEAFKQLPPAVREALLEQFHAAANLRTPAITEDTMPGELPNIVAGRVANVLNLRGPSYITDAACASSFAALEAAVENLINYRCNAVLSGGVDRNMGVSTFVKFSKIGALSATGSRPFGEGADGFVMGEGAAAFLLKRLADAERDGDKIYAVIRGVGGASDGKGKGITAPNPIGQQLATERAWENAGLDPATATLLEAHGTSTKVGDVVEFDTLAQVFRGAPQGSIALGSAKSNIGHLKAGAGAAGLLKAVMAVHDKVLPPTLNAERPNPNIDFHAAPFIINSELREWPKPARAPRRAGVSAYGFGGTNFHIVLEEYVPGMLQSNGRQFSGVAVPGTTGSAAQPAAPAAAAPKSPIRGIFALGADSPVGLKDKLDAAYRRAEGGWTPPVAPPAAAELTAPERLMIDFGDHDELLDRIGKARKALGFDNPAAWKAMAAQGIFRGSGPAPGKIAFLFPGQGSQYLNMGRELAEIEPVVAEVFAEADEVMKPILGKPLTDLIFIDSNDAAAMQKAELGLMQTAITQPAMLTIDTALLKLLGQYGMHPDMVMGHSLGEYAALIAAGIMPFADALEAAAARGSEMTKVSWEDNGWMAAVMAPYGVVEDTLAKIDGYVVAANINSSNQSVIGGASKAVEAAMAVFQQQGYQAIRLPVSHAFHTKIVAPASKPLRKVLDRLHITPPQLPLVGNVNGKFYPDGVEAIKDLLELQIASPVQWVKGLETLYAAGARTFVEVGAKKALKGFVDDVLGSHPDVVSLFTNHPKAGELPTFNQALCGLYAAGYGRGPAANPALSEPAVQPVVAVTAGNGQMTGPRVTPPAAPEPPAPTTEQEPAMPAPITPPTSSDAMGQLFTQMLQQMATPGTKAYDRNDVPLGSIVISGTGLGLPGVGKPIMDPDNALRILHGEQFVDLIPERFRNRMADKHVTRVVKAADGSGSFETISDPADVIKLAARAGAFDLAEEYGVPGKLVEALDITTQLAMAAGLDALREAGIPLVQTWRPTTTGKFLPDRWMLPEALRDETGVIFASAFPGGDRMADEFERYYTWQHYRQQMDMLQDLRLYTTDPQTMLEIDRRIEAVRVALDRAPYAFDRRFLFRVLSMGHSQFAEYVGARGPNTQVNAACASTAQAVSIAEDWIRSGRCRRVLVIGGDDVTSDHLLEWIGSGFLATGAAAIDDRVEDAALPFDRRRHGMLLGMGACGLVVESEDAVRERGMRGIVELLSSETGNSAFHATRLDVDHISMVMNNLVTAAERRFGVDRRTMAPQTVFVSHETYTPARGGSASAEVMALRSTFGEAANQIVMANTKGFTGHPMGVGIEDVIAVKILEYGIVPPVPNFKEVDPELGMLTLSRGGHYPVQYAVHLAAGFGSQISLTLTRRIPGSFDRIDNKTNYGRWLDVMSGYDNAQIEVIKRVLRVVSKAAPQRRPAGTSWRHGTGPVQRADAPGASGGAVSYRPAPMVMPVAAHPAAPVAAPARPAAPPRAPAPVPAPRPVELHSTVPSVAPVAPPPVAPPAIAPAPLPAAPAADPVVARIMDLVADKTGYPSDMLDLELDLEADLGIDTVKQAETFAAIREAFDIPVRDDLRLRDYPTLRHIVGYVHDSRPDLAAAVQATSQTARQPAAAPAPAPVTPAPVTPAAPLDNPVQRQVMAIVAEKTGYPQDMLDLELDMEADLGIDTVKQAETFAAIREAFDIPQRDNVKLRDYPTLGRVIDFVYENRPDLAAGAQPAAAGPAVAAAAPPPAAAPPAVPAPQATGDGIANTVLKIVAEKTGYPQDMLDLELDMEADLGIDTVKQAETFAAIREAFDIPQRENVKLRDYPTLGRVIDFVYENRPDLAAGAQPAVAVPPTPPAAAPPAPAPAIPAAAPAATDVITPQVLAVVAEKTGYPEDMLDLELDMEADLGIDTVKQAETFAAIREAFDIPRRDDVKLRDYPTLASVIGFVRTNRPDLAGGAAVAAPAPVVEPATPVPAAEAAARPAPAVKLWGTLADADRAPRRVVVPVLRPALEWCKPTGVILDETSRVLVVMDRGGVGKALVSRLQKRGVSTLTIEETPATDALEAQVKAWLADGPIQGVYWLPALDIEPNLEDMDLTTWRELNRVRVKNLYTTMRALYDAVSGPQNFLISAVRLGGQHGYGPEGALAPLGGAVSGFTKAYKREREQVLVKAVDFEATRKTVEPAELLIAETLTDPGALEIGYKDGLRYTVSMQEIPAPNGEPGMVLNQESVFVVTGAAGGITSAITTDLAVASGGVFYLLDVVPVPERDDADIKLFRSDKEALKGVLIERARAAGERPTPVTIDKQIMTVERNEAALRAVESVEAAGGTVYYRSVNLLDEAAVTAVVDEIRKSYGRIDVLLHAGGLLIDRPLPDKEAHQFNLVFDVKADGFFLLLRAAKGMPLGATVSFSSVAGRFGNAAQSDYSAANDLLCKVSSSMRTWRPETRGIAIDWTAWGTIGMATRGSVPKIMEMLGIDMLPPEVGVPTIRRELTAGSRRDEIVVGLRLGALMAELDATGGLDPDKVQAWLAAREHPLALIASVKSARVYGGIEVETTLDPQVQPFLFDHQIDGVPVLPGVMGTESFAELASLFVPGYRVVAIENEQFMAPFKFYRQQPRTLYLQATALPAANGEVAVQTLLTSVTQPPKPELPIQVKEHFRATVRLAAEAPRTASIDLPAGVMDSSQPAVVAADIYKIYFHGPAYQVLERVHMAGDMVVGLMFDRLPPNTVPADADTLMAPRLIEFCFQTAGIWEIAVTGTMALPLAIGSVTTYRQPEEAQGRRLIALVTPLNGGESFDATVVDEAGNVYVSMAGYKTVRLPGNVADDLLQSLKAIL